LFLIKFTLYKASNSSFSIVGSLDPIYHSKPKYHRPS